MKYVIIGGHGIEGIRSLDDVGEITLVSAEEISNYGRPLISYYLEGKTDLERMSYRGLDFYERNRVTALHGVKAERMDPEKQTVLLSGGETLSYDKLCVCTGASPFVPAFEGLETVENKFTFMTLADAQALEKEVHPEDDVLILGGGLIGLKAAEGLRGRASSVTVCDLAPHVLSSILQPESAAMVERHLEEYGIRLLLGDSVKKFAGRTAITEHGAALRFDVLVLAVGVRSNISLISEAGGETGRGITVDETMATTLPNVYAAGDCVGPYLILPSAARQGRCAGVNMAGGHAVFDSGVPMNSIGLFGLHLMTAGRYEGEEYVETDGANYKKLFVKDDCLVGFILVGNVERAGIYTALIREQRPLSTIDFEAVRKNPSLLPFGPEYRSRKLGDVV